MNSDIDRAIASLWHKILNAKGSLEVAKVLDVQLRPVLVAGKSCRLALKLALENDTAPCHNWETALKHLAEEI